MSTVLMLDLGDPRTLCRVSGPGPSASVLRAGQQVRALSTHAGVFKPDRTRARNAAGSLTSGIVLHRAAVPPFDLRLRLLKSEWAGSGKTEADKAERNAFIQHGPSPASSWLHCHWARTPAKGES